MSVDEIVQHCIKRGYISERQAPWLCYAIKKHMGSLFASLPILMLASYLATPIAACFFYCSFCWLRSRTNGIHAKTFWGCMVASLFCVLIFMGPVYHLISDYALLVLLLVSVVIIWLFAPFNHPNMHLTNREKIACMNSARRRVLVLLLGASALHILDQHEASVGILLGIVMAALLLALAFLFQKETNYKFDTI